MCVSNKELPLLVASVCKRDALCARMTIIKWGKYIFHVLNVSQKKEQLVVAAVVFAERNPTVLVAIESVI